MQDDIVEQNQEIISVGELNRSAKYLLEDAFTNIAVIGHIVQKVAVIGCLKIVLLVRFQESRLDAFCR